MAYIDPRKQLEEQKTITGGSGTSATGETVDAGTANGNTDIAVAPDPSKVQQANAGYDFTGLLKPFQDSIGATKTNVGNSWSQFQSAIGADDPFDSSETTVLDSSIRNGNLDAARNVLNRSYTGPSSWASDSWKDNVTTLANTAAGFGDGTDTTSIARMMQQTNPALSAGQSRFDALLARNSDAFQTALKGAQTEAESVLNDVKDKQTKSTDLISSRQKQAADVRNQSMAYLQNQQNNLTNTLNNAVKGYAGPVSNPVSGGGKTYDRAAYYSKGDASGFGDVANDEQIATWNNIASLIGGNTISKRTFDQQGWNNNLKNSIDEYFNQVKTGADKPLGYLSDQVGAFLSAADNSDFRSLLDYAKTVNQQSQQTNGAPSYFYNNMANEAAKRGMTDLVDPSAWVNYGNRGANVGNDKLTDTLIEKIYGSRPDIQAERARNPNFNLAQWYLDYGRYGY